MNILSELNSINTHSNIRLSLININFSCFYARFIYVNEIISSLLWKYSGGWGGFIAAAAVLTSTAACGAIGLLSKNQAHSSAPRRGKSGPTLGQADSSAQGASDATAS